MKTSQKLVFSIIGIAAALFFQACGGEEKQVTRQELPTVQVKAMEAKVAKVPMRYEFAAQVTSADQAKLSTRIMGQITMLSVEEGEKVQKGQVVARIKSADIEASKARVEANMNEAMAALANVEKNYNRIKQLYDKKSATQKELDDITAAYDMAKAKVASIEQMQNEVQANLGYAVLTAPFTGYITKKFMNQGDLATPGMPVVMIESQENFEVKASVPETEIGMMNEGDEVHVAIDALNQEVKGTIARINPSGGYAGAQFEMTVLLQGDALAKQLKSGLFATVIVEKGATQKLMVPKEVLVQRGQLKGFYTINHKSEAMLRWVRTGKEIGDSIEILSGLDEGEQIIVSYEGKLQDGQKVALMN